MYVRYVDDFYVVIEDVELIEETRQAFESQFVLSFTHEDE